MSQFEFDALRTRDQDYLEASTLELRNRFGDEFFTRNNDRLRDELEIRRFGHLRPQRATAASPRR